MKHLSLQLLAEIVTSRRKTMRLSQAALSEKANINRSILSRLEAQDYSPSVDQLLSLSSVLDFQPSKDVVMIRRLKDLNEWDDLLYIVVDGKLYSRKYYKK